MTFLDDGPDAVAAAPPGLGPVRADRARAARRRRAGLGARAVPQRSGSRARPRTWSPTPRCPRMLRWLPGADEVVRWTPGAYGTIPGLADTQALLCFDSGDTKRLGGPHRELPPSAALVNVDHHVTNTRYGHLNWVDEAAPSVGAMVFQLLRSMGLPVDPLVALPALPLARRGHGTLLVLEHDARRRCGPRPTSWRPAPSPRRSRTTSTATRTSARCGCARGASSAWRPPPTGVSRRRS